MKKVLSALIFVSVSAAYASTYQGLVQEIRISASSSGGTRVSVLTSGTTDCRDSDNHWYAFEYSKTGPGSAWLAALLSAKVAGETLVIHGAGTCDGGTERVAEIDLPSPSMSLAQEPPPVAVRAVPGLLRSCSETSVSAMLLNLRSPTRVPGQYMVMFKSAAALACISSSKLNSVRILPGVMPDSPQASRRLADALAQSIRATVIAAWDVESTPTFAIRGATDQGVEMLARDPRIAIIEADLRVEKQ